MGDSRVSISIYRAGSYKVETGPTGFLPGGKKLHIAYTDDNLRSHGSSDGSTIVMTDNGCITLEAWEEPTPNVAKGIRKLPHNLRFTCSLVGL